MSLPVASLVLLICVLAQLSHLDHIAAAYLARPVATHSAERHTHQGAAHDEAVSNEHKMHCHDGMASCSDVPVPAGPGQLLLGRDLLSAPLLDVLLLAQLIDSDAPSEVTLGLPLRPPRDAIAAI